MKRVPAARGLWQGNREKVIYSDFPFHSPYGCAVGFWSREGMRSTADTVRVTLRASLSGTFLQKNDVVNQCLEFACEIHTGCDIILNDEAASMHLSFYPPSPPSPPHPHPTPIQHPPLPTPRLSRYAVGSFERSRPVPSDNGGLNSHGRGLLFGDVAVDLLPRSLIFMPALYLPCAKRTIGGTRIKKKKLSAKLS